MIPIEYYKGDILKRDLDYNLELAFSTIDEVPFNFEKNFQHYNVRLQFIKDINKKILKESISEAFNLKSLKLSPKTSFHKGSEFDFRCNLEKNFWIKYIDQIPKNIRYWNRRITMKISKSFLESF